MMAFDGMNEGAKIEKSAVNKGFRSICQQERADEVDLVLFVPTTSEKWTIPPSQSTTCIMIVSRPYVSSVSSRRVKNDIIAKEARGNHEVVEQATCFRKQTMHGTDKKVIHQKVLKQKVLKQKALKLFANPKVLTP